MKNFLKKCIQTPVIWKSLDYSLGTLSRGFRRMEIFKRQDDAASDERSPVRRRFKEKFPDLIVKNGPFRGMKYPSPASLGSTIYPKLLGSYEKELAHVVTYFIGQSYSAIVDIGCAEGYYAVGLGRVCKNARIYAFDIDKKAREACQNLAELNDIKVEVDGFCDAQKLLSLELGEKALIFSDCESYENDLFTSAVAVSLQQHDVLIELHDFMSLGIRPNLMEIFEKTHQCELVASIDDLQKVYEYDFPELEGFSLKERFEILAEGRRQIMWWLVAKAK